MNLVADAIISYVGSDIYKLTQVDNSTTVDLKRKWPDLCGVSQYQKQKFGKLDNIVWKLIEMMISHNSSFEQIIIIHGYDLNDKIYAIEFSLQIETKMNLATIIKSFYLKQSRQKIKIRYGSMSWYIENIESTPCQSIPISELYSYDYDTPFDDGKNYGVLRIY